MSLILKYLWGFFLNIFNPGVIFGALVDHHSKISSKAKVYFFTKIFNSEIDDYSYVCPGTEISKTTVGKFCSIGPKCKIGLPGHTLNFLSTSPVFTEKNNAAGHSWISSNIVVSDKHTIVGNDVWIGADAILLGGVSIGNGAVIGAGAVVTKDVPPYAIVGGVPAKIIRYRFSEEVIEKLNASQWWNLPEEKLRSLLTYFQSEDIKINDFIKETNSKEK